MQLSFSCTAVARLCALLTALSGCGGGTDTSSAGAPSMSESRAASGVPELDPCSLVTQAEIEEILGVSVTPPEPSVTPAGRTTYYSCTSDDIHINVEAWDSAESAAGSFEAGTQYPAVEGLGYPARNTQPLGEIDVLAGQFVLTIDLYIGEDREAELDAAKRIAMLAIDRLP